MRRGRTKSCKSCKLFRFQRLKIVFFAPLLDIKAGAGFGGVLVVAVDGGDVVLLHQVLHQLEQSKTLERGAGVGRATVSIEAADIGDADAVGVVAFGMCAGLLDGSALVDAAVGVDDVMIANVTPAEGTVVAADAFHGADCIGARGGAVENDFGDGSHFFIGLVGLMGCNGIAGQKTKGSKPTARGAVGLLGQGLGGGEVEDVDGVTFGVVGGVFEGDLAFGDGVVAGWLHQTIDEDTHGTFGIGRFGEGDFGGEVHAVDGQDRRVGEGNVFLRGHDLAVGEGEAYNGLGGGARARRVGGVNPRDGQGGLGDL